MSVKYSPFGNQQFVDENGDPAVGWKIYAYVAGSSTEQATYTDSTGNTANANPIVLDALGKPANQIWLTDGASYKFILKNASDVEKDTQDNIFGVNASETDASQWVPSGVTPTYISTTSFSLVGDQTTDFHVGRRLQFTTTAGTVYGLITVSAYTSLTTITVSMDSGVLDSGLSDVNLSILTAINPSLPNSAAVRAALGFTTDITKVYDSGDITFVAADADTLTHGLGATPKIIEVFLKCTTADLDYSIGDILPIGIGCQFDGTNSRGIQIKTTSTEISYFIGASTNSFALLNSTSRLAGGTTNTSWRLIIRAYA